MERWSGKVALVTGASVGIGAAIVLELVKHGVIVVGLARRVEKVKELQNKIQGAKGKLYALQGDISKEEDIIACFKWIKTNLGKIHILVNNAGFSKFGKLVDGNPQTWRDIFNVNVIGLSICTQQAFKLMKETDVDDGHIIHINSLAGHRVASYGDPNFNVYPATKHAVTALTETLRQELRFLKTHHKITSISPGVVETEFLNVATQEIGVPEGLKEYLKNIKALTGKDVADAVIYVLSTPPHVQVHELMIRPNDSRT